MNDNGITRAEDYIFEPRAGEHKVKLPSGATFLLRYPGLNFTLKRLLLAQSIAARIEGKAGTPDEQHAEALSETYYAVLCEVCVSPKVSMEPKEGELHPDRFKLDDAIHILRWAGGEIDAQGNDLAKFRRPEPAADALDGSGGAPLRPVAERSPEDVPVGPAA
jgi:hypothetical protein